MVAGRMAQWVKPFPCKPDDLGSVSGTHMKSQKWRHVSAISAVPGWLKGETEISLANYSRVYSMNETWREKDSAPQKRGAEGEDNK